MIFALITLLAALSLASVAGWFSIIGITAIYAGAPIHALIMGVVLEGGKLVTTSWLYRNWKFIDWKLKTPLIIFTLIIMLVTSIGVFGYLSKTHLEQGAGTVDNTAKVERLDQQIAREKSTIIDDEKVIGQLDAAITSYIGKDRTDKSVAVRKSQTPQRNQLRTDIESAQKRIDNYSDEKFKLQAEVRKLQLDVGPIRYIAELFYGTDGNTDKNIESAVRMFTLIIVSTLDPLAVVLLIAANHTILRRQDEEKKKVEEEKSILQGSGPSDIDPKNSQIHNQSEPISSAIKEPALPAGATSPTETEMDDEALSSTMELLNEEEEIILEETWTGIQGRIDALEMDKEDKESQSARSESVREPMEDSTVHGDFLNSEQITWPSILPIISKNYIEEPNEEESINLLDNSSLIFLSSLPIIRTPAPSHVSWIKKETTVDSHDPSTTTLSQIHNESEGKINSDYLREIRGYTAGRHFVPQRINEEEKITKVEGHQISDSPEGSALGRPAPLFQINEKAASEKIYTETETEIIHVEIDKSKSIRPLATSEDTDRTAATITALSWLKEFKRTE